jgi:Transposase DDE domain
MAAQVRRPAGQALSSRRQVLVEPVCGQIKEARGCRRFLRRGWDKVRGAWRLVGVGHNGLQLWREGSALRTVSARQSSDGALKEPWGGTASGTAPLAVLR